MRSPFKKGPCVTVFSAMVRNVWIFLTVMFMRNQEVCLQVTLICVPNPGAVFVELLHHCHGDNRERGVHVGVLRINQDSDFVDTGLRKDNRHNTDQSWSECQRVTMQLNNSWFKNSITDPWATKSIPLLFC